MNESVANILVEWRECIEAADPSVWNDARIAELVKTTKAQQLAYLDRIEAAWKREREPVTDSHAIGNAAAMREALLIVKRLFDGRIMFQPAIRKAHKAVDAALSAPARNCDVGTAEEQYDRFVDFCQLGAGEKEDCDGCRLWNSGTIGHNCELRWAQMPYAAKEGGAQ